MTQSTHAPHAHAGRTIGQIMVLVMLALVPATVFGFWLYGWPAIFLWLVALLTAALSEAFTLRLRGMPAVTGLKDGSALLTGWLLALSLPPWAPWWLAVVGSFFAVVISKQVFGGLGQNVFNPAMAARVMLLIAFPVEMTAWVGPQPITSLEAPGFMQGLAITFAGQTIDSVSSASLLGHVKTEMSRGVDLLSSVPAFEAKSAYDSAAGAWGLRIGSLGETSALLVLLGGLFLIFRRIITWHVPVAMLLGATIPALLAHAMDPNHYLGPVPHLLSGGLILGAFFIATDPVTSPNTVAGQLLFGLYCGALTWVIRTWGGYPEGVAFAVMIMNAATPVIDRYIKPRIYGRDRHGKALPVEQEK